MKLSTKKYAICTATEEDSQAIKELFEHTSYNSLIDLQFRRGDDPYQSFMDEDAGALILLAKETETGKAIGMGACSFHEIYLNGEVRRGGYLNGLKLLPEYQKRVPYLPKSFSMMHDETKDQTDVYYAMILQWEKGVQRLFERRHANMPSYDKQCLYTSFLFAPAAGARGLKLEKGNVDGLDEFYEQRLPQYNLAPTGRHIHGISDHDFITWRENGRVLASCALFNNQKRKNYFLNGYHGAFRFASHLPTRLLGLPAFPKAGKNVNTASLSLLLFDESLDTRSRARFIKAASSFAKGYNMVVVGLAENDPSYRAFERIRHVKFSSYLYTLNWEERMDVNQRPIYLDVAYI